MALKQILHFFQLFKIKEPQTLVLSEKALSRLNQEREKRKLDLLLEVKVLREKSLRATVQVGFSVLEPQRKRHPIFGHYISELDFLILAGGEISYDEEEGKYLYFPNIDIEWKDTPKQNIKRILANRPFTYDHQIWTSIEVCPFEPIQKILQMDQVSSCYAKENMIQIEFVGSSVTKQLEEEISEWILIYFAYLYPPLAGSIQNHQ